MARKKKSLESKLGRWTDQASLTRTASEPAKKEKKGKSKPTNKATHEKYLVSRSLIDRLADAAQKHNMSQNQVVGYLLTWSLDQLDAGTLKMPGDKAK